MARAKSEDKRNAILDAAIAVFAERGVWSTPTVAISKAAGVAEGTLFVYFSTKEQLANELYRLIKSELAEILTSDFPERADVRGKFLHIWQHYIRWGVANPAKFKVMTQLQVSDQITPESKAMASAALAELERAVHESIEHGRSSPYPIAFLAALLTSQAETTMAFVARHSGDGVDYSALGFEIFWRGLGQL